MFLTSKHFFLARKNIVIISISALFIVSCSSPPPEATTAIDSLNRLNARLDIGINQIDYAEELGNAKADIEKFRYSKYGLNHDEISKYMETAEKAYHYALKIWEEDKGWCKLDSKGFAATEKPYYCLEKSPVLQIYVFDTFPELRDLETIRVAYDWKKVTEKPFDFEITSSYLYEREGLIQALWSKAKENTEKAESLLNK